MIKKYHETWKLKNPQHLDFYSEEVFRMWCKAFDISGWYQGKRCISWQSVFDLKSGEVINDYTPREDHCNLFRRRNGKLIFITEPYGTLTDEELRKINQWSEERNLIFRYHPEYSWHAPGSTILLTYENKTL